MCSLLVYTEGFQKISVKKTLFVAFKIFLGLCKEKNALLGIVI